MWCYHHGFGFFPFVFIPFGMIILFALCFIVTRIVLFRRFRRFGGGCWASQYGPFNHDGDAEAVLKRRLANGEISETEYNHLKDVLKQ